MGDLVALNKKGRENFKRGQRYEPPTKMGIVLKMGSGRDRIPKRLRHKEAIVTVAWCQSSLLITQVKVKFLKKVYWS